MLEQAVFPRGLLIIIAMFYCLMSSPAAAAENIPADNQAAPADTLAPKPEPVPPAAGEAVQLLPPKSDEPETDAPEQAVYPGVANHVVKKGGNGKPLITLNYPQFGQPAVDAAMREFAEFQEHDYEDDLQSAQAADGETPPFFDMWEMTGFYNIEKPNPDVVSVVFNIYSFSGGAHGMLMLQCLNYNLKDGSKIEFSDLFQNPDKALEILSDLSAKKLRSSLGIDADEEMIAAGTAPELNNFSNLTLAPASVFVEFPPYQVGPWSIGPQRVEVTLAELGAAGPSKVVWPNFEPVPALAAPEPAPDREAETIQ